MSLTTCPECAGKVSDKALACPHCGHPVENRVSAAPLDVRAQARADYERHKEEDDSLLKRWEDGEINQDQWEKESDALAKQHQRFLDDKPVEYQQALGEVYREETEKLNAQLRAKGIVPPAEVVPSADVRSQARDDLQRVTEKSDLLDMQLEAGEINEEQFEEQQDALFGTLIVGKSEEYKAAVRLEQDVRQKEAEEQLGQQRIALANRSSVAPATKQNPIAVAILGGIIIACALPIISALRSAGDFQTPRPEPSRAEIQAADYRGLAIKACDTGWNAIARQGGIGKFDKTKFDVQCVERVTQAATDCARSRSTASGVTACIGEVAPTVAARVLEESL